MEAPMAYVPGRENDLFIGYAHDDDCENPVGERWVTEFHNHLAAALTQRLGTRPVIFRDVRIRFDEDREGSFGLKAARESAAFLAILSPSYLAREQTKLELRAFAEAAGSVDRLTVVERLPIDRAECPPELLRLRRTRFYEINPESGVPRVLTPKFDQQAYIERLETLVDDLYRLLREVRSASTREREHRETDGGRSKRPFPPQPPLNDDKTFDVFISYPHQNKATAEAACAMLESDGIRCWIAPRDIIPGMDWGESIVDAINGAKIMVLIFSRHANASPLRRTGSTRSRCRSNRISVDWCQQHEPFLQ
jgi:TIR domain